MAMLAEPKRKQRWSLNPRGKHWSDDSNKFGQKMLEKMGWSSGKGLGANLDGIKEHVKISYKNDSQGMGFKENGEQWTQHEDKFSSLLENLTEATGQTTIAMATVKTNKSLEEKSRSSRSRLHYHKFTRGKDLSGRSSKDLAAIFGRKTLERSVEPDEPPNMQPETGETKAHGVLTTIQAGNMQAYFKSKMSAIAVNLNTMKDESESEMHSCGGLGFVETKKRKRNNCDVDETISKCNTKKKHLAFDNQALAVDVFQEACYDNPALEDYPDAEDEHLKKRKRKILTFASPIQVVQHSPKETNITKKKKLIEEGDDPGIDNPACEVLHEHENKQSTKKQKCKDIVIDNPACEVINKEEIEETGKKLKKKQKYKDVGIDNPACDVLNKEESEETPKKLKKKKKQKYKDVGIDNQACEVLYKEENEDTPKKLKKKQKYKDLGIDNPACEVLNKEESEETPKKLKKKKKMKQQQKYKDVGIDNPACEVNPIEESVTSINTQLDSYQNELENEMNEQKIVEFGLKKKKHLTLQKTLQQTQKPPAQEEKGVQPKLLQPAAVRPTWQPQQPAIANTRRFTRVDKSSLAKHVKPGELKLLFKGTNLDQISGYGCIYYK